MSLPLCAGVVLFLVWTPISERFLHRVVTSASPFPAAAASGIQNMTSTSSLPVPVAAISTETVEVGGQTAKVAAGKTKSVVTPKNSEPVLTDTIVPLVPNSILVPIPPGAGQIPPATSPPFTQTPPPVVAPAPPAPAPTAKPTPPPAPPAQKPAVSPPKAPPASSTPSGGTVLFSEAFTNYGDGLITNEYAFWNPGDATAKKSDIWELTSGSLFARDGAAWSGSPDSGTAPNALSSNVTGSGIFRLTTKRADFLNVKVSFDLNTHKLVTGKATPAVDWDGVHIFLRYQSEYHLYYASINRRDNAVVIKKKVPGGPSNGGTYYNLSTSNKYEVRYNAWQKVYATIKNENDGSVIIELYGDGKLVASAKDSGEHGEPIRTPGKVGIRADNAEIAFKNFVVTKI